MLRTAATDHLVCEDVSILTVSVTENQPRTHTHPPCVPVPSPLCTVSGRLAQMTPIFCNTKQVSWEGGVEGKDLVVWGLEVGVRRLPTLHTHTHPTNLPFRKWWEAAALRPG